MQNKQNNVNPFKKQLAACPFNPAHTFIPEKFFYHINRCKDKQKRLPYMAKCKYNPTHYVDKDKLELHEDYCFDRKSNEEVIKKCQKDFRSAIREDFRGDRERERRSDQNDWRPNRSRSRQRKIQEPQVKTQKDEKIEQNMTKHSHTEDQTFSDCEQCQSIVRRYKNQIKEDPQISKLLKKYELIAGYSIL